ncbi:hypothetical protein ACI2JA_17125 [Alkalihalobacillus sp. NPDC078783]
MKKIMIALTLIVALLSPQLNPIAFGKEKTIKTDEWSLTYELVKDEKSDKYRLFDIELLNTGKEKNDVQIFSFRNEPNKSYDYGLSFGDDIGVAAEDATFSFSGMPVSNQKEVKEFEIIVVWKVDDRKFKELFVIPNL